MAERKAQQKYLPPDFDPRKHKNVNSYQKQARGKQQSSSDNKVRFEMPMGVFCLGCDRMIAAGTRFNSTKRTCGKYLSTDVSQFSMKCLECQQQIVIQTDPQNAAYICVEGVKAKTKVYEASNIGALDTSDHRLIKVYEDEYIDLDDVMIRLELLHLDRIRGAAQSKVIEKLQTQSQRSQDHFEINQSLKLHLRRKIQEDITVRVDDSIHFKDDALKQQERKRAQLTLGITAGDQQQSVTSRQAFVDKELKRRKIMQQLQRSSTKQPNIIKK
ncbi:hypothetical protein MIR68_007717 [Amoeboaphelidium protococcarum]|nr:hypothetical protein MIR68_007717 [Amoeboaphelidium protococcarum]